MWSTKLLSRKVITVSNVVMAALLEVFTGVPILHLLGIYHVWLLQIHPARYDLSFRDLIFQEIIGKGA